jgi:hypothetical protein
MNPRRETGATFVNPTTSDVMVVSMLIGSSFLILALTLQATHSQPVAGETQITSLRARRFQAWR